MLLERLLLFLELSFMRGRSLYYLLAIFNVFIAAVAQMMLKKSASQGYSSVIHEYINPWIIGGYALMGISLLSNIYVMSHGVLLKEVGAIGALSYLFVPILAVFCFKEKFSKKQILAIGMILAGSVIFFL